MSNPNYAKLVSQGRAKGYGQPWSENELTLLQEIVKEFGYSTWTEAAEFVRRGAKSVSDVKKIQKADDKGDDDKAAKDAAEKEKAKNTNTK